MKLAGAGVVYYATVRRGAKGNTRSYCDTIAAAVAAISTERLQHLLTDADWDSQELDGARVRSLREERRLPGQEVGRAASSSGTLDDGLLLADATFERCYWCRLFSLGGHFPLGQAHDASGEPQAGTAVAAGGPGAMVRRNREDQDLPAS